LGIIATTSIILISLAIMIWFGVSFFQKREAKWKTFWKSHIDLQKTVKHLGSKIKSLESKIATDAKINKLENKISYLEGRNEK